MRPGPNGIDPKTQRPALVEDVASNETGRAIAVLLAVFVPILLVALGAMLWA